MRKDDVPSRHVRTCRLRSIPKHDTTEGRVLFASGEGIRCKCGGVDIARTRSGARGGGTDINLNVRIRRDCLGPVIPCGEVPVVGVVKVGEATVVAISSSWWQ